MAVKPELQQIYYDNIRTNQIGETDGISPEVASDLGYHTPEQLAELLPLPGTASIEVHESDAFIRGVKHAKTVMNNPDASKSDWPSATIGKSEKSKAVACADCGATGGCAHMGVRRNGKGYTKGY